MVIKKRFMSLLLAVIMAFGVVSPSFAAGTSGDGSEIEPFNNRYYYKYETEYLGDATVHVSADEAKVKDTIKSIMANGVALAIGYKIPDEMVNYGVTNTVADMIKHIYAQEPFARAGRYEISTEMKYKYRVDRLDETRRYVETKWLVSHYEYYKEGNDGNVPDDTYTGQLTMK